MPRWRRRSRNSAIPRSLQLTNGSWVTIIRGVASLNWYKRARVARDPDDLLKDPEFVKKAVETYTAQARANPVTHQPNAAASLPSVSRAGVPASTSEGEDPFGKMADEDAYEFVLRDKQGRFASRA
jgi:hypothetical protein